MNCETLIKRLGYQCRLVGEQTIAVDTPFSFADGEVISFYLEQHGSQIVVHDNADTISHLQGVGWDVGNRRNWKGIKNAVESHGLKLDESGLILCEGDISREADYISNFISALLSVVEMEKEQRGLTEEQQRFVEEVEFCLREKNPGKEILHSPSVRGHSGKTHLFHFEMDGKLIEASIPHGRTTGAILRKSADVVNADDKRKILVVIDDRDDPERAKAETDILTTLVSVMQFSKLQGDAKFRSTQH